MRSCEPFCGCPKPGFLSSSFFLLSSSPFFLLFLLLSSLFFPPLKKQMKKTPIKTFQPAIVGVVAVNPPTLYAARGTTVAKKPAKAPLAHWLVCWGGGWAFWITMGSRAISPSLSPQGGQAKVGQVGHVCCVLCKPKRLVKNDETNVFKFSPSARGKYFTASAMTCPALSGARMMQGSNSAGPHDIQPMKF